MVRILPLVGVAIGTGVATKAYEVLVASGITPGLAIVVSVSLAVAVSLVVEFIFEYVPRHIRRLRPLVDSAARFEGIWLQTIDMKGGRLYSYVEIDYDAEAEIQTINGVAYSSAGVPDSTWAAHDVRPEAAKKKLRYEYVADKTGKVTGSVSTVKGFGEMTFERDSPGGRFSRGSGYYVDAVNAYAQGDYVLDRLTPTLVMELIGKDKVTTSEEKTRLIIAWHAKHGGALSLAPTARLRSQTTLS